MLHPVNLGHNVGVAVKALHNPQNDLVINPVDDDAASSSVTACDPQLYQAVLSDDCESAAPKSDPSASAVNDEGLKLLSEGNKNHDIVKDKFLFRLGWPFRNHIRITAVYKNMFANWKSQGISEDFEFWIDRMERKRGGSVSANVQIAWVAVNKDEMLKIVRYGFRLGLPKNDGSYGGGIYLVPGNSPLECLKNLDADEEGLRYVLLCRVILGKTEVIEPGSQEDCPSTTEFDSGVDNLDSPSKYIIWGFDANAHILPEFVLSFRAPSCLDGLIASQVNQNKPTSPFVPFSRIISSLAEFLCPSDVTSLNKCYEELTERKITRQEMILRLKELAGQELLVSVVKSLGFEIPAK